MNIPTNYPPKQLFFRGQTITHKDYGSCIVIGSHVDIHGGTWYTGEDKSYSVLVLDDPTFHAPITRVLHESSMALDASRTRDQGEIILQYFNERRYATT